MTNRAVSSPPTAPTAFYAPLPAHSSFVYPGYLQLDDDYAEFEALTKEWRGDTMYLSSVDQIASHPNYLQIVAKGHQALPYILRDLEAHGGEWYRAIRAIAAANHIDVPTFTTNERKNSHRVETAWIQWGKRHGFLI